MTTIAAIQMTSSPDVAENLATAARLLEEAASRGAALAGLPENFAIMGRREADKLAVAETDGDGPIQQFLASTARRLGLWIIGGTIPCARAPTDALPPHASSTTSAVNAARATTRFTCSTSKFPTRQRNIANPRRSCTGVSLL